MATIETLAFQRNAQNGWDKLPHPTLPTPPWTAEMLLAHPIPEIPFDNSGSLEDEPNRKIPTHRSSPENARFGGIKNLTEWKMKSYTEFSQIVNVAAQTHFFPTQEDKTISLCKEADAVFAHKRYVISPVNMVFYAVMVRSGSSITAITAWAENVETTTIRRTPKSKRAGRQPKDITIISRFDLKYTYTDAGEEEDFAVLEYKRAKTLSPLISKFLLNEVNKGDALKVVQQLKKYCRTTGRRYAAICDFYVLILFVFEGDFNEFEDPTKLTVAKVRLIKEPNNMPIAWFCFLYEALEAARKQGPAPSSGGPPAGTAGPAGKKVKT